MATALERWNAAAATVQRANERAETDAIPLALDELHAAYNALYDIGGATTGVQQELVRLEDDAERVWSTGVGVAVRRPFAPIFSAAGLRLGTLVIPWVGGAAALLFGFVVWRTTRRARRGGQPRGRGRRSA